MILDIIYSETLKYIGSVSKKTRKEKGQFFTSMSVSSYMAKLSRKCLNELNICDCGAGTGLLTAALCEELYKSTSKRIHIDLYENDENILPLLKNNMKLIQKFMIKNDKEFSFNIIPENFILHNKFEWLELNASEKYDIIISNPPYKKLSIDSDESIVMKNIVKGQPNIYFLFLAMSAKLLKHSGEMIFINPRSFTTGAYFKEFRKWFLNNVKFTDLHLFESRDKVFDSDKILQESLILRAEKTDVTPDFINISSCDNLQINNYKEHNAQYNLIVDENDENYFIRIPSNNEEVDIIKKVHSWNSNLISLGFKLKTGPVVDFRTKENLIFENNEEHVNKVPLLWACNIVENQIVHQIESNKPNWILDNKNTKGILIENKDYIILKRFSSKEEDRRIQAAIYMKNGLNYQRIGLENHLNYIMKVNGSFTSEELYGLFVVLNTTLIDKYYRISNGSTQVNANEMNSMPLPQLKDIVLLGKEAMNFDTLTVEICDNLIKNYFESKVSNDLENITVSTKFKEEAKSLVNY